MGGGFATSGLTTLELATLGLATLGLAGVNGGGGALRLCAESLVAECQRHPLGMCKAAAPPPPDGSSC